MKTHDINWHHDHSELSSFSRQLHAVANSTPSRAQELLGTVTNHVIRASVATLAVMGILVGAILGSQYLSGTGIMEASIWAVGFVFLALAIESKPSQFVPLFLTGLSLPVLAWFSSSQSPEFVIIAAVLVASWVGAGILKAWKD